MKKIVAKKDPILSIFFGMFAMCVKSKLYIWSQDTQQNYHKMHPAQQRCATARLPGAEYLVHNS
jgi:hypothetical protein